MIYSVIKLMAEVKARRKALGYSQAQLSTVTGYDRSLVNEWEAGGSPRLAAFVDVVQQLGGEVSIQWSAPGGGASHRKRPKERGAR